MVGRRNDRPVGDLGRGGVVARREHPGAVAHALGGLDEHPPELTASDHAQGRGRVQDSRSRGPPAAAAHKGDSPTEAVCAARYAARASRTRGYCRARIAAASKPALAAPALPIARVPTGIPFGIWTIESSESTPRSTLLST